MPFVILFFINKEKEMPTNNKVETLQVAWNKRLQLRTEGDKFWTEGSKLCDEVDKLWDAGPQLYAEGFKLRAEGFKLRAKGSRLRAEGGKLWSEAILEVHGNIKLEWKGQECHLETGEVFK